MSKKTYLCDLKFVRSFKEQGTFPIAAESEEKAKEAISALFGQHDNLEVVRIYEVDECPQLAAMVAEYLTSLGDDDEGEEPKEPSIN